MSQENNQHNEDILGKKRLNEKIIIETTDWNKKQANKTLSLLTKSFILNIILALALTVSIFRLVEPHDTRYFAMDDNLTIMPLIALDKPYINDTKMVNFVSNAITEMMTFSYFNWEKHIHKVSKDFSYKGFQDLKKSLIENGIIESIKKSRLNLIASLDGAPVVVKKKIVGGVHTWFVKIPVVLSYESSKGVLKIQHLEAKVIVQRVPTVVNPKGVQIKQLTFSLSSKNFR